MATTDTHLRAVDGPLDADDADTPDPAAEADSAGKSVEELAEEREQALANGETPAGEEPAEEKPVPPMQLPLMGTRDTILQSFGGQKATSSEMRLMGGKQPIEGQFEKGEVIELIVKAKVFMVAGVDSTDDWGNVQKTVRRHHARIIECRRFEG